MKSLPLFLLALSGTTTLLASDTAISFCALKIQRLEEEVKILKGELEERKKVDQIHEAKFLEVAFYWQQVSDYLNTNPVEILAIHKLIQNDPHLPKHFKDSGLKSTLNKLQNAVNSENMHNLILGCASLYELISFEQAQNNAIQIDMRRCIDLAHHINEVTTSELEAKKEDKST